MKQVLFAITAVALSAASTPSRASVLWTFSDVGNDIVSRYYGTLDVTGLTAREASGGQEVLAPVYGFALNRSGITDLDFYLATGPEDWDSNVGYLQDSGLGDPFGVYGYRYFLGKAGIFVNRGYVSGSEISGGQFFLDASLSDFGMSVGQSFTYTLETGDTLTVAFTSEPLEFPDPSPVPVPAAMPLLAGALGVGAALRRRRRT